MIIFLASDMAVSYDLDSKEVLWESTWEEEKDSGILMETVKANKENFTASFRKPWGIKVNESIRVNYKTGEWQIFIPENERAADTAKEAVGWVQKLRDWWSGK